MHSGTQRYLPLLQERMDPQREVPRRLVIAEIPPQNGEALLVRGAYVSQTGDCKRHRADEAREDDEGQTFVRITGKSVTG